MKNMVIENVQMELLVDKCRELIKEGKRLIALTGTDRRQEEGVFRLYYLFGEDEKGNFLILVLDIQENEPSFPSITPITPSANWPERELQDLFGLAAKGHPAPSRLVMHEDWPAGFYPLRKDFNPQQHVPQVEGAFAFPKIQAEGVTEVPVGPIHAGIIEPGHFLFQTMGEEVLQLDAKLFYTHRGLEKHFEGMNVRDALVLAEQTCGVCVASHSICYTQALEEIAGIQVSNRVNYLRTLLLEMERLYNHIGDLGNICAGIGFAVGNSHGLRLKEELLRLNKKLFGHRYLRGYNQIGGVRDDLTISGRNEAASSLAEIETDFTQWISFVKEHDIFIDRLTNTGRLPKEIAAQWGVVGPAARASGVKRDVRVQYPHAAYSQLPVQLITGEEGDVLARFLVRMQETLQSFGLIRQILAELPLGTCQADLPKQWPEGWAFSLTESPRGENMHWVMLGAGGTIERYHIRSAAFCNWPVVPLTVPGNIIADFPLINKSFELCYACCDR